MIQYRQSHFILPEMMRATKLLHIQRMLQMNFWLPQGCILTINHIKEGKILIVRAFLPVEFIRTRATKILQTWKKCTTFSTDTQSQKNGGHRIMQTDSRPPKVGLARLCRTAPMALQFGGQVILVRSLTMSKIKPKIHIHNNFFHHHKISLFWPPVATSPKS